MMTGGSSRPALGFSLTRSFNATPEQVFRAFTDPDWYSAWWGPPGCQSNVLELNLVVGGTYRVAMDLPDGTSTVMYGSYRQIDPPRLLSYSLSWEGEDIETLVTLEIEPAEEGTELTVTHEGFTDQDRCAQHEHGWTGSLERLLEWIGTVQ